MPEEDRKPQGDPPDDEETDDVPVAQLPQAEAQTEADAQAAAGAVAENEAAEDIGQLRQKAAERDELYDKWLRAKADYVNLQQRGRREMAAAASRGLLRLAEDLLPVLDAFDRALDAAQDTDEPGQLIEGLRLVRQALHDALSRHGVEPIPAQGEPFDPNLHEAVMTQAREDVPDGTVVDELRRGYRLGERVIRATQVAVARNPQPEQDSGEPSEDTPSEEEQQQED